MKMTIITLFPKMIEGFFEESIVKRAIDKKLVEIEIVNLRDFAKDTYGSVDDRPYAGGAGMVLRVDVLKKCLDSISTKPETDNTKKVVLTSAKGKIYNQKIASDYSKVNHIVLIAGHYEGFDERVLDYVDEEISMGDFVMTGGEIAVSAIVDSIVRLIPGVLKKESATVNESFFEVDLAELTDIIGETDVISKLKSNNISKVTLLEYPQYTRPQTFENKNVPDILLSGNPKEIHKWQLKMAYEETIRKRPDLLNAQHDII
jgi:tRNA (guanine37-N1)-methyltransferase